MLYGDIDIDIETLLKCKSGFHKRLLTLKSFSLIATHCLACYFIINLYQNS